MSDAILASAYGVKADGSDMTGLVTAAIQAALQAGAARLVFPSGTIVVKQLPKFLPASPTKAPQLWLQGNGQQGTFLRVDAAADCLAFDFSGLTNKLAAWIQVSDIGFFGNPPQGTKAGTALSIDWGAEPINSAKSNAVCSQGRISNVELRNFTNGIYLRNAWNFDVEGVFGNGGQLGGKAIRLDGCVAMDLYDLDLSFWQYGVYFGQSSPGYACQGIEIMGLICETMPCCLSCDPAPLDCPQQFEGLGVTGFDLDNGNYPLPGQWDATVALHNLVGFALRGTSILQLGGLCQIYLNNCISGMVEGLDFTNQSQQYPLGSASVVLDGITRAVMVGSGCRFGSAAAVLLNENTLTCRCSGNLPSTAYYNDMTKGKGEHILETFPGKSKAAMETNILGMKRARRGRRRPWRQLEPMS